MDFYTKEQPRGAFHKMMSSYNEIFGKTETATSGDNRASEETAGSDFKKDESVEIK
jgi:hypothetical protein